MSLSFYREAHFAYTGGDCMQSVSNQAKERTAIGNLPVVNNFRRVIETCDMSLMNKELYQFLNLYCGFIAHYNIHGFKNTYAAPRDFADVFIRHFDRNHRYFCGNYSCHDEPYQNTGASKAEIKRELFRIVDRHKDTITKWVDGVERDRRHAAFEILKNEFEADIQKVRMECELCGESIELEIKRNGRDVNSLENLCCLFCGQHIRMNQTGGKNYVEHTIERETGKNSEAL